MGFFGRPGGAMRFGVPADDPFTARIFPPLPGVVKWGLARSERILAALGSPHRAYPVLHVGGTNGKGSVAWVWAGVLKAAGFRVGLYTSPHLTSFHERIRVNGRPASDRLLEECAQELRPFLLREDPSFFEATTALAFLAFARSEVDAAVVEVGMGGRLDATNVVAPVLTAITNVAMDHREMLGESLLQIAREKGGILKPGVPAFTATDDPAVLNVLREEAAERGALLRRVAAPDGRISLDGSRFRMKTARWGTIDLASPMPGRHQIRNIALAVRALEALPPRLPVSSGAVREGVLRARAPGRFQVEMEGARRWVFDVAHNPHAADALARTLEEIPADGPRAGLVGILSDKGWREMLARLAPVFDTVILTVPPTAPAERRWDLEAAAGILPPERTRAVPDFGAALAAAGEAAGPSGTVVVTGSSYTVGSALTDLRTRLDASRESPGTPGTARPGALPPLSASG